MKVCFSWSDNQSDAINQRIEEQISDDDDQHLDHPSANLNEDQHLTQRENNFNTSKQKF